jgi:secreted PhoX family phosphatase
VFDVGFRKGNTTPLVEMGRFSHEALMVDPASGAVYETEDSGNAGFYRFAPYREGQLDQGGRLVGLTVHGEAFTFAMNNMNLSSDYNDRVPAADYRQSEWAGACFSPDGQWLFANIQTPGVTFAVTGPWHRGPL